MWYQACMTTAAQHYRLTLSAPDQHLVDVEMRVDTGGAELGDHVDLHMAAWCPGSYLIRDYARFVRDVVVTDGDGNALASAKIAKHTWRVELKGAATLVVRYRVYGHDLTVRTNHIDSSHAFLHAPATYLYVDELRDQPCRVTVEGPHGRGWHVATGLARDGSDYLAADLDELFDCPVHLGQVSVREFVAADRPVELVVWGYGPGGVADLDRLVVDLNAIIEAHASRFGAVPYERYTFILMLADNAYGGLEHRNSSANLGTPHAFATRNSYEDLLELLSHEFFHVWNGKRIYPEAFSPFDYNREAYTHCLWVIEGLTSYIDRHTLRRADRMGVKRYFEKLLEEWARLLSNPGRHLHSLTESSFDAWIKLYKPDESNINTTVSYYLKGGFVALALDLEIRQRSAGQRSLDDVVGKLWDDYGSRGIAYPEAAVAATFAAAAGFDLGDFFARFIDGHEDPDLTALLAYAGLELEASNDPGNDGDAGSSVWLGIGCKGESATVATVLDVGPAAAAGLSPGDEIIAANGYQVKGKGDLGKRLAAYQSGDEVELALFRRGQLTAVIVTLVDSPPTRYKVVASKAASDDAKKFYSAWLADEFPEPGVVATFTVRNWV